MVVALAPAEVLPGQPPLRAADPKPAFITVLNYGEFLFELEIAEHVHDFLISLDSLELSWYKHTLLVKHNLFHITNPETQSFPDRIWALLGWKRLHCS